MNTYTVCSVEDRSAFEEQLFRLPAAGIAHFPWDSPPHPNSYAILAAGPCALHVFLRTDEEEIRAEQTEQNGPIYTDSCLEVYLMPSPSSGLYLNIEVNPKGVMFFSVGKERAGRRLITAETPRDLNLKTSVRPADYGGVGWTVLYDLPYATIHKYVPEFDPRSPSAEMRGNFYKCGNGLTKPHWGMWSPVEAPKPDFHRPEYFGRLVRG